ncbi:alpha-2,8-polysialyltransferase family protein [Pseudomonas sp. 7P_10.2_Bac1]|uniref:alpha-2,8-polysialyltransferase family protein n=1 Tax=Pseudomonas sp. 7P_10.2_Bac1 TaxID=2971614 RepID=UPI0021C9EAEA|nr:alpha-2,8-polysialyltransferase family protein [Pseudomonas sp. 7P_10.2_Bac1]MCU1729592.1 alpha-2,8-polysialyltransferase family protein [Pseudomonas sp. 7P_10.2_Bac1]
MTYPDKSICLLYTTYHSFLWDLISKEIDHKHLTVINFSKRPLNNSLKSKIIERTKTSKINFIITCLAIALKAKTSKYNLTLPHPDHLLGNTLFFNKNALSITLLEDGILNYYHYKRAYAIAKKSEKRKKITQLTPFKYNLYSGHLSGVDDCPTSELHGWFTDPEQIINKEKFKSTKKIQLPSSSTEIQESNNTVILLDQPLEKFLSAETAKAIREKAKNFIEKNFKEVIIKPHPEHASTEEKIANEVSFSFEPNIPIEEVILRIEPSAAISFCSTALINISKISSNTQCIAIGINEIVSELPDTQQIKELFLKNNIKIH